MKRSYFIGMLLLAAVPLQAQSLDQAYLFAENNYYGTARSVGLGNAVSALGGDLGSIGINPAGSAVSGYSQFTLSPGVTISSVGTYYESPAPENERFFEQYNKSLGMLPNTGVVVDFDLGRPSGVKSWSMGFVLNSTNNFGEFFSVYGENGLTSQLGSFAQLANGIDHSIFDEGRSGYYDLQTAYNAYMFDYLKDAPDQYVGATENKYWNDDKGVWDIELADKIGQSYFRRRTGVKNDVLFNMAMNVNDVLYLGANFGFPIISYTDDFTFREISLDRSKFQTGFDQSEFNDYVSYSATGLYAKLGAIWRPMEGLRVAAAIQTPTLYSIEESYGWYGSLNATGITDNEPQYSEGDYSYEFRTAPITTLGLAYTIPGLGLVSFDYETTDYGAMRFFQTDGGAYGDVIATANDNIKEANGRYNQYRAGVELKMIPQFSVRGGFTGTQRTYNYDRDIIRETRTSVSGGVGYSSNDSFFADLAVRCSKLPDYYNYPYDVYDPDMNLKYASPEICAERTKLDVVLTLGWRF